MPPSFHGPAGFSGSAPTNHNKDPNTNRERGFTVNQEESQLSSEEFRQINDMLKSQLPFIGAVALSRPGWDAEDFIESFAKDWGIELEVLPDERGPGQPFSAALPGTGVVINIIERPGRMGIERFVDGANENYVWPEGRRLIRGMQSELMIAVGGGKHRNTQAALFVRAAATILDNESAIGFLDCDVLRDPVHFRKTALALRDQALATPILFWIGLSRMPDGPEGEPRLKAWTNGLSRFGKLEMEIPSTSRDIHDAFILLNSAACYVLDHDADMKPGEALEWQDGEVPLSLGKSTAIDEDMDVLVVDLDGVRPKGDGVVENKDAEA